MKKTIFYIAVILFMGCGKKSNSLNNLIISHKKIKPILASFVRENKCDNCIYEVYVDKQDPHIYKLLLYKGIESLTKVENEYNNQTPIGSINVLNSEFDVYSGAEHYFTTSEKTILKKNNSNIKLKKDYKLWVVKDSFNIISVEKRDYAYPYMTLPKDVKVRFDKRESPR